jgi:hypothetical protein
VFAGTETFGPALGEDVGNPANPYIDVLLISVRVLDEAEQ